MRPSRLDGSSRQYSETSSQVQGACIWPATDSFIRQNVVVRGDGPWHVAPPGLMAAQPATVAHTQVLFFDADDLKSRCC